MFPSRWVATVLTVYGIETTYAKFNDMVKETNTLQQYLPFTVLKHCYLIAWPDKIAFRVATVLTVYGIETDKIYARSFLLWQVATVLTVYGIETMN